MTKPVPPLPQDVAEALAKGHLLEAVKRLRAATPMGLAEAKSVIEWHIRHNAIKAPATHHHAVRHHPTVHAPMRPGLAPGEVPKTSGGGMGIAILLAVAAVLVSYFLA